MVLQKSYYRGTLASLSINEFIHLEKSWRSFFSTSSDNIRCLRTLRVFREVEFDLFTFIKICQNTPQLCWGDEWLPLSPGGRGLGLRLGRAYGSER